jgi:predicted nucleotidyltransferase component of viral defense system
MQALEQHERFELEVLDFLNSSRILSRLVFGGGTMLRLCHGLPRYSVDLDFYLKATEDAQNVYSKVEQALRTRYQLRDARDKLRTILFEITHSTYPRRLKLEINKTVVYRAPQVLIAYSPHDNRQVMVNTVPLPQMMNNKIRALLDRREIRDAHDIEFLLRLGVSFPAEPELIQQVLVRLRQFTANDFSVKLGSLLPPSRRAYYQANRFAFLEHQLQLLLTRSGE